MIRGLLRRNGFPFAVLTTTFLILLGLRPIATPTLVAAYAIALAALALAACTRAMAEATHDPQSPFERELARRPSHPSRPTELIRISRDLTLATSSAAHVHERLRPLFRDIAEARLGLDLRRRAATARPLLGEDVWEIVRPDAEPPADRETAGLPLRRIRAMVDVRERL